MRKSAVLAGAATAALVLLGAGGAASTGYQPDWGGHDSHHRNAGRTFVAQLKPLNAGAHTVANETYTIPSTRATAVV
jgi:hypothetical protein